MKKHALVTGGNGFLGGFLIAGLKQEGYTVTSLSRHPAPEADINLAGDLTGPLTLPEQYYHLVVHAAGKAHVVPKNEEESQAFFAVNREGTRHLLQALDAVPLAPPAAFVHISTVAVYGTDKGEGIDETTALNAKDPYGVSKKEAEELVRQWAQNHKVPAAILRLPLVAGYDPPGNLGAMIQGLRKGRYFNLNGGTARRSVVLAEDVAAAIPRVIQHPGTYNLTDGAHPSFAELAALIHKQKNYKAAKNLSKGMAGLLGMAGSTLETLTRRRMPFSWRTYRKMTHTLTFSDAHARNTWDWRPHSVLSHPEKWL